MAEKSEGPPGVSSFGDKLKTLTSKIFKKPVIANTQTSILPIPDSNKTFQSMDEVIGAIPQQVPEDFKDQAKEVAGFITQLDQGGGLDNPNLRVFVGQLVDSGFRAGVYIRHKFPVFGKDSPSPENVLPVWLQNDYLLANGLIPPRILNDQEKVLTEQSFNTWVVKKGFKGEDHPNGRYYAIEPVTNTSPLARAFKCYVEGVDLLAAFQANKFEVLFKDLQTLGVGPNDMKLSEGNSLVLYFNKDIQISDKIKEIFARSQVAFRGPAQDVMEITIDDNGQLVDQPKTSNDGALGEGGKTPIDYKMQNYTPAAFLDNYLQLCLWAGKNPQEPYKTSFVYLVDREGKGQGKESALVQKATQIVGYPVLYAQNRLAVARK